jgi:hypothetical protein
MKNRRNYKTFVNLALQAGLNFSKIHYKQINLPNFFF